jgi:TolB-like protein
VTRAELSASEEVAVPAEDIRAQLDRILKSTDFEATARERRFLSYVVEETLNGRASHIKAYSIAVEVFGRDAAFDPQNDPIVRIEAGHLRRSLERYYLTAGQSDRVHLTIPKGGYVPTFALRNLPVPPKESATAETQEIPGKDGWRGSKWSRFALAILLATLAIAAAIQLRGVSISPTVPEIPRVLVEGFENLNGTEASAAIASGLTQEIIDKLSRFKDLVVIQSAEAAPGNGKSPRYALHGSVDLSGEAFRLRVRFVNQKDGSVLWANSYDGNVEVRKIVGAQADIAHKVATTLGQTYGVIFQAETALSVPNAPDDWTAYSCTLSYYAYRARLDLEALPPIRACLEQAVQRFPKYATAWGLLAQTYIDEIRYRFPHHPVAWQTSIDQALAAARRAVELDPLNIRGLQAEMFGLYLSKDFDAAEKAGERAMAINPNDTELIGEYGYRLALSGKWNAGCPLIVQARERNPGPFAYYESGLALCAYFAGDHKQAVMWIRKTTVPKSALYHLIAAVIFGEAGDKAAAAVERTWLENNAPALMRNLREEITLRLGRPEDVETVLASLRKAGLEIPDR